MKSNTNCDSKNHENVIARSGFLRRSNLTHLGQEIASLRSQ